MLLTHLHFDHAAGSTRRDGERLTPAFPNARYYVQRRNWDNALNPNPRERASYMPENFQPLASAGVMTPWDGPQRPWPGVELFTAEGHTRGQQLVRVHGPEGTLYFVADLIPTAAHVRIPYVMGYDVAAIETMAEKRTLLERAVLSERGSCSSTTCRSRWRPKREGDDFGWDEIVLAPGADSRVETAGAGGT